MTRLHTALFMPLALLLLAPAAGLGWLMLHGAVLGLDGRLSLIIAGMALAGLSGVIWCVIASRMFKKPITLTLGLVLLVALACVAFTIAANYGIDLSLG